MPRFERQPEGFRPLQGFFGGRGHDDRMAHLAAIGRLLFAVEVHLDDVRKTFPGAKIQLVAASALGEPDVAQEVAHAEISRL